VIAVGEAKWHAAPVTSGELDRLRHLRAILPGSPEGVRLLLFSRSGFTTELADAAASAPDVDLVDIDRLYAGS
jgi:hypothetical protein